MIKSFDKIGMKMQIMQFLLLALIYLMSNYVEQSGAVRSFSIDYGDNTFIKDGKPFRYISGSIHYSRVPYYYWRDRLKKMYSAGLDAIQVYIPWNVHEPEPGVYDFTFQNDVVGFIQQAQAAGLLVILRAGPYICGEWDYGGFPYWLKRHNESIVLRTTDPGYLEPVTSWFKELLPRIKPLLYENGGPIIMVQVENEYGSYRSVDCGHDYMRYLRDLFRSILGSQVILFTTDGAGAAFLTCGAIEDVYATVDFGPGDASKGFEPMRKWNPKGPLVNSEYYTGWLTHWGEQWHRTQSKTVVKTLDQMLAMGANVNMYMFHGGTNFGFMNGANTPYKPVVTSYGYDAPLSEAGDVTNKYHAIRDLLQKYKKVPPLVSRNTTKANYGSITMRKRTTVFAELENLSHLPIKSQFPITMETAGQAYGFAGYRTKLKTDIPLSVLNLSGVRDRAYILLDGVLKGVVYRTAKTKLQLSGNQGQMLLILVENMGRINFGPQINENRKGLISNVTWNNTILTDWEYYRIDLLKASNLLQKSALKYSPKEIDTAGFVPSIYTGSFQLPPNRVPQDTFVETCGWTKGVVLMNNFTLGRYWPVIGPQITLYVPRHTILPHPLTNTLTMLELEGAPCNHSNRQRPGNSKQMNHMEMGYKEETDGDCSIRLLDHAILGGKCKTKGEIVTEEMTITDFHEQRTLH